MFIVPMSKTTTITKSKGGRKRMRLEEVVAFVNDNKREILSGDKFKAGCWACVDGRIVENDGRFTAPGGVLGIMYAVVGGLQAYEEEYGSVGIAFGRLTKAIEGKFGGMTFHSDTHIHNHGKPARVSAGCGHCNGALDMADQYGLERYVRLLEDHIDKFKKRGVHPEVLHGEHNETAVLVISKSNGKSFTLPGTGKGKNGQQAFICHLDDWLETVTSLALEVIKCADKEINGARLREHIVAAAKRQLGVTLRRLANGLPVYRVFCNEAGAIDVELMADAAETIS